MKRYILFSLITTTVVRSQTSSPTTAQPTTAQVVGNTCSACTTSACVYYRHAYGPNVEEVTIGCASPTLSPTCVAQSGNFGVGASGVYSFGGASTQVNIASASPTGAGATKKLNIGANAVTATSQEINVGATTSGIITVGGALSTVNIATGASTGTVTVGSSSSSAQTINIAPTTTGTITVGGTGSAVNIASGAATGTVTVGSSSSSAQTVNIAPATTGTITIGGPTQVKISPTLPYDKFVAIAADQAVGGIYIGATDATPLPSPAPYAGQKIYIGAQSRGAINIGGGTDYPATAVPINIGAGASTGTIQVGSSSASAQNVNIAPTTTSTITVGGSASTVAIGGSSAATTTIINNTPWNQWGMWSLGVTQTVTSFTAISFSSATASPSPTPSTVATNFNTNAPTSLPSGRAIILGNCRAFVASAGGYFPIPAPTSVLFPMFTTQAPSPTPSPVSFCGDCVYVQQAGLYQYQLNIEASTPTPSPSVVDNIQFSTVYNTGAPTPFALASTTNYLPITKDGTSAFYRGSSSQIVACSQPPCLFMSTINTAAGSAAITASRTTLSVMALRSN
jgi:hypothetical protein